MRYFLFICTCFYTISSVEGKDFGVFGTTFPIVEQNLKHVIQEKAKNLSGDDLQKRYKLLGDKIKKEGKLFTRIVGIEEAVNYASSLYDPTTSLKEDVLDGKGDVLFKKGTKINPLDHISLDNGLLFFDGNNSKHIEWAEKQKGEFKWILIEGDPVALQEKQKRAIFFDQGGVYSKKFHIQNVPCRITQSGKSLLIEEIPVQGSAI